MESTVTRPAVDVAPTGPRARPGLALLLAILSIPGSTIAWDLPLGGLWIGLPLGVAAILLGISARRRLPSGAGSKMALAAIVIGALAIAQMAIWFVVSAVS
jgi:hypothetical protein